MIVRLTIQQDGTGFRATLSKRNDKGKGTIGHPEIFLVGDKEEAKKRAKDMARDLGLKTYRVVDKTLKV
jgi:predicted dinucleotide-binding enzyme